MSARAPGEGGGGPLGPQRRPTVTPLPPGTVAATITAGWRAREPEDAELDRLLGGGTVNLRLYERWLDVLDRDHELAAAEVNHRAVAEELQELYALQVERANQAMDAIRRTATRPRTRDGALSDAEAALRLLDERHLDRMSEIRAEFEAAWRPAERDPVARHRDRSGPSWTGPAYSCSPAGTWACCCTCCGCSRSPRRRTCWPGRPGRWR